MRTKILLLFLMLLCVSGFAQTSVQFILSDPQYGISQTTNVQITLQAENVQIGGPVTLLPLTLYQTTDTNGQATFTNLFGNSIQGFYHWTVPMNPVQNADGDIWVQSTNLGLVNASSIGVTFGANTYPAGWWTWSAVTADQRYAPSATNLASYVQIGQLLSTSNSIIAKIPSTNGFVGPGITNGLLGTNTAYLTYYPTSNPSQFVTSAITNGLVTTNQLAGLTNGFVTTNFVQSSIASSNAALATTNFVIGQIQIATNGLASTNQLLIYATTNQFIAGTNSVAITATANLLSTSNVLAAAGITSSNGLLAQINSSSNFLQQTKQPGSLVLSNAAATGYIFTNILAADSPYIYLRTNVSGNTVFIGGTNIPSTNGFVGPSITNGFVGPAITNGFVGPAITNGLLPAAAAVALYYPTSNPSGFVTGTITNGLALSNQVVAATNGITPVAYEPMGYFMSTNYLPGLTNLFVTQSQLTTASNGLVSVIIGTNTLILQQVTNLTTLQYQNSTNFTWLYYLTLSNTISIVSNTVASNAAASLFYATNNAAWLVNGVITNTTTNAIFSYLGTNAILAIASTVAGSGTTNFILGSNPASVIGGYTTNNNFTSAGLQTITNIVVANSTNPTNGISAMTATNIADGEVFKGTNTIGIGSGLMAFQPTNNWATTNLVAVTSNALAGAISAGGIPTLNGIGTNTSLLNAIGIGVTNMAVIGNTWLVNSNMFITEAPGGIPSSIVVTGTSNYLIGSSFTASNANGTYLFEGILNRGSGNFYAYTNSYGIFTNASNPSISNFWELNFYLNSSPPVWIMNFVALSGGTPSPEVLYETTNGAPYVQLNPATGTTGILYPQNQPNTNGLMTFTQGTGQLINVISNTSQLVIDASGGVTINSNLNVNGQVLQNGIPIGSSSAGATIYSQIYVYGAATNFYNGNYTLDGLAPVYTNNANTAALLLPGTYAFKGIPYNIGFAQFVTNAGVIGGISSAPSYANPNETLFGYYSTPVISGSGLPGPTVTVPIPPVAVQGVLTNATFLIASQNGCKFGTNDDTAAVEAMYARAITNPIYILQDGMSQVSQTITNWGNTTVRGASEGCGYFLETNVNDFLYTTPLNGDVFTCSNILIENITFNCNGLNQFMGESITNTSPHFEPITNVDGTIFQTVLGPAGFSEYNFAVWFNSCINLNLKDCTVLDAPCFGITFGGMVSNVNVQNFTATWSTNWLVSQFGSTHHNHDGFHIYGNSWNFIVNGLYIINNDDDWFAIGGNEFSASAMTNSSQGLYPKLWTNSAVYPCRGTNQGLVFNTTIQNVFVTGTNGAGLAAYTTATNNNFLSNTKITDVHGTMDNYEGFPIAFFHCNGHPSSANGASDKVNFDNLDLENIYMEGGPNAAGFHLWFLTGTNVTIRNFNTSSEPEQFSGNPGKESYVWQNGFIQNMNLEDFHLNVPNTATSESNSIFFGGYAAPTVNSVFMRGMSVTDPSGWFRSPIMTYNYYGNYFVVNNNFPSTTVSNLIDTQGSALVATVHSHLGLQNGIGNGGGLTNVPVGLNTSNGAVITTNLFISSAYPPQVQGTIDFNTGFPVPPFIDSQINYTPPTSLINYKGNAYWTPMFNGLWGDWGNMYIIGDSWTVGFGLTGTQSAYITNFTSWNGWQPQNRGVSGTTAYTEQAAAFLAGTSFQGSKNPILYYALGINDYRLYGAAAIPDYMSCVEGSVVQNITVPVKAQAQGIPANWVAQPWATGTTGWAMTASNTASSMTITNIGGSTIYIGYGVLSNSPVTMSVNIDGVAEGTFPVNGSDNAYVGQGTASVPLLGCLRFPVAQTNHTVIITKTSSTDTNNLWIVWVSDNYVPNAGNAAYLYQKAIVMSPGRQNGAGYSANGGSDAIAYQYGQALQSMCFTLAKDGLPVEYHDINKWWEPTLNGNIQPANNLHPTEQGNLGISKGMIADTQSGITSGERTMVGVMSQAFSETTNGLSIAVYSMSATNLIGQISTNNLPTNSVVVPPGSLVTAIDSQYGSFTALTTNASGLVTILYSYPTNNITTATLDCNVPNATLTASANITFASPVNINPTNEYWLTRNIITAGSLLTVAGPANCWMSGTLNVTNAGTFYIHIQPNVPYGTNAVVTQIH